MTDEKVNLGVGLEYCLTLMRVSILGNEALLMQHNHTQHMNCTCVCLFN